MDEIVRMRREGVSVSEIGRLLEVDRKTVRKYLKESRIRRYDEPVQGARHGLEGGRLRLFQAAGAFPSRVR